MSDFVERVNNLSEKQRKLLALRLKKEEQKRQQIQRIERRRDLQASVPLSFAQQRMWILDQLQPGTLAYVINNCIRITGIFQISACKSALKEIVTRHEALRTIFVSQNSELRQVTQPLDTFHMSFTDVSVPDVGTREQEAQRLIQKEVERPFDLERGPLFRAHLFRLDEHEHLLLISVHHAVFDGWSLGLLMQEFGQLYAAFRQGLPSPLQPLPLQYGDFAQWQQEWLQGSLMREHLAFWKQQLLAPLPVLDMPTDHPRPALQTYVGARYPLQLSQALTQAITALGQEEGGTLFMGLLTGFAALLSRYTGQLDLLIGTPIANRNRSEIEALIGCFINTLVLRIDLSGDPNVREGLRRVQTVALNAYAHQDTPFEQVVDAIQPERDRSRSPIFQTMFILQNAPQPSILLDDLVITLIPTDSSTARFDLICIMWETLQGLQGQFEYNTDLFEESTIVRLAQHFENVLTEMVKQPDTSIATLPFLSASEEYLLLQEWNATKKEYPTIEGLHQLVEAQVERTPDADALVCGSTNLTYQELNHQANQLAHYLMRQGVGPEVLVGVCLERSASMLIAVLGVLKAGGAYVPIDPAYPVDRIAYMLQDSQVQCLLTQQQLIAVLPATDATIICLDRDWGSIAQEATHNVINTTAAHNLAYILYTSGSTGRPKGVQISHRALINFQLAMRDLFNPTPKDTFLAVTTLSFDIAGLELYLPLISGARVSIETREVAMDGIQLLKKIQILQPTFMQATPATWRMLLAVGAHDFSFLNILCGGDTLSVELRDQLLLCKPTSFWNLYGPTETTIWSLVSKITSSATPVTIGHPIANTQVYILDTQQQLVPVGVPGELYIGGAGLARGYLHQPELTQEKFIPNPFNLQTIEHLYRTGDVVRYLEDGTIDLLGRIDNQVKIRGFRIELEEIEAVLNQQTESQQAIVMVREDTPGDKRLVAYILMSDNQPTIQTLLTTLKAKLPEYMVPTAFVFIETFPLTPNGKIDRRALPAPEQNSRERQDAYVAPRTLLEIQLAEIWQQVLGLEHISIHDDFFALGGHSLKAIQALTRIRENIQKDMTLNSFFQSPTISAMALSIGGDKRLDSPYLVPLNTKGTGPILFCFHPLGGEVAIYQTFIAALNKERPLYGLQSRALLAVNTPEHETIEAMAHEYAQAIRMQQPEGPYYLLGWSMGGVLAFAVAAELEQARQKVAFVGLFDSYLHLAGNARLELRTDPLEDLFSIFGMTLTHAFMALPLVEQEALREELLTLAELERFQYVLHWAQEHHMLVINSSAEDLKARAALVHTHRLLLRRYQAPVISAPLFVWWAHENSEFQRRTNWREQTKGAVQDVIVEGVNHFSLIQAPHVQGLMQQLNQILASV